LIEAWNNTVPFHINRNRLKKTSRCNDSEAGFEHKEKKMFAVIKTGGKQYSVAAGDLLKVETLVGEPGEIIEINEVLMVGDGDNTTIGTPYVDGAAVAVEVVQQGRARKVIAFKKRRRQNSKRTIGHRQHFTEIKISEILTGGAKASKKAASKKADAKPAAEKKAKVEPKAETKAAPVASLFTAPEGNADDLKIINGIGPVAEKQLNEQGIMTYAQVATFTDEDIVRIDEAMPFSAAQIETWRDQAKDLIKGK